MVDCAKCKLSALCLPAGGADELAKTMWYCDSCRQWFRRREYETPLTSLALPPVCEAVMKLKLRGLGDGGICNICHRKMRAESVS